MARITVAQLEAFFWTAQLGSSQQAARHLHLTQPSISLRLRDLREAVGLELFERGPTGLRLTFHGRALLGRATTVLDEVQKMRDPHGDTEVGGPLRFGMAEGFAVVCLPPLLKALSREFPSLRPELVVATSDALERLLTENALDLAILVNPVAAEKQRLIPLGAQTTSWVAPAGWDLPATVRPADLLTLPIISNPAPSAMYRQTSDWFATAAMEPTNISICSSVSVSAQLIAAGIAMGVLPTKMAVPLVAEGRVRIVASVPPIEAGKVYASHPLGAGGQATDKVIGVVRRMLQSIDYFTHPA
jgi:DNA-binding transcriptional LysR family regulator